MKHKIIKDIARIISCTNSPEGSAQMVSALAIYFEDEAGFNTQEFKDLALKDTLNISINKEDWAYTPTSDKNHMDAIEKSGIRMKLESGFGIPNDEWERQRCLTIQDGED